MVFRTIAVACAFAAAMCLTAAGQSAPASSAPTQAPSLRLQNLPPEPTTPTPQEIAARRHQQAIATALRLAQIEARWGAPMSTPGLSIKLVETGKTKLANGETQVSYEISGSGFASTDKLELLRWPLNLAAKPVMGGIGFNAKGMAVCMDTVAGAGGAAAGTAIQAPSLSAPAPHVNEQTGVPPAPSCAGTMKTNQPIVIRTVAAPGEPVRVALLSQTQARRGAATMAIPFPIEDASQGCKLQVILGMKDAEMVLVDGSGFPASATLKLTSITYGRIHHLNSMTSPQGKTIFALLPAVDGHPNGETEVRFDGVVQAPTLDPTKKGPAPNPTCRPEVSFHWGQGSYKPE